MIEMLQDICILLRGHNTPPWRQQRVSASWPFSGVFVLHATAYVSQVEGAVMR